MFSGAVDSSGHYRTEHLFTDLEPGTYELSFSSSNTEKTGGYWYAGAIGEPDKERWTRMECRKADATITI